MSGGAGNDTFFFEIGSGNDTITDFSRSSANGPDTDSIVVDGNYLGSTSSFFGTTLYFDYNNDGKSDGTVLLLGVSKSEWALDLQGGALVDRSGLHGAMQNVAVVEQTDNLWTTHSATDGSWMLA